MMVRVVREAAGGTERGRSGVRDSASEAAVAASLALAFGILATGAVLGRGGL